jgi:hypothetical protein
MVQERLGPATIAMPRNTPVAKAALGSLVDAT